MLDAGMYARIGAVFSMSGSSFQPAGEIVWTVALPVLMCFAASSWQCVIRALRNERIVAAKCIIDSSGVPRGPSSRFECLSGSLRAERDRQDVMVRSTPRRAESGNSLHEVMLHGVPHELGARRHAHLFKNTGAIRADGRDAQVQLIRDLTDCPSERDVSQDLEFTVGQGLVELFF